MTARITKRPEMAVSGDRTEEVDDNGRSFIEFNSDGTKVTLQPKLHPLGFVANDDGTYQVLGIGDPIVYDDSSTVGKLALSNFRNMTCIAGLVYPIRLAAIKPPSGASALVLCY